MSKPYAGRGDVWLANLDPTRGHEQAGIRPVIVLSVDPFNKSLAGLVIVAPLTSKKRGIPTQVEVRPPEGGCTLPSFIKCEDVRSISTERLIRRRGVVTRETQRKVEESLRALLGL